MSNRVLLGDDGLGNFVFKVTIPGKDVLTATNPNDFAFNSLLPEGARLIMKGRASGRVNYGKTIWPPPLILNYRQISSPQLGIVHEAYVHKSVDSTGFTSIGFYMVFGYNG